MIGPVAADDPTTTIPVVQVGPEIAAEDDASEFAPPPIAPEALSEGPVDLSDESLITARPTDWITPHDRRCREWRGRRFCDGPLMAPRPHGPAAELASRIDIGRRRTANILLGFRPRQEWVDAVVHPASPRLMWPVEAEGEPAGGLWRGLHREEHGRPAHKGIDIGAPQGTRVRAANGGMVVYSQNQLRGFGNLVVVVHADESVTMYAHLHASYVFPGQQVRRGQVIGEVGHTGLARGAHLHFEWRLNGSPHDPLSRFVGMPERVERRIRARARRR